MPVIPKNRLLQWRFRPRKGSKVPIVEPLRKRVLIDNDWVLAEEDWCWQGRLERVWTWRRHESDD